MLVVPFVVGASVLAIRGMRTKQLKSEPMLRSV
jgi:hypothetical protein